MFESTLVPLVDAHAEADAERRATVLVPVTVEKRDGEDMAEMLSDETDEIEGVG